MAENRVEIKIVADNRQAAAVVGDQTRAMSVLAQRVEVSQASFKRLAVAVAAGNAALLALTRVASGLFINLPRSALNAAVNMESLEAAMKAVFGTAEATRREMEGLRAISERLGLPLETLARQWLGFAAAAKGTALEGEAAREVFLAVSEAATVLGMSQDQLAGALLAVQQMISKGVVSSEELRQQLGERLYGAVQVSARGIGLTSEAFNDLLERGMVPVDRFLPALARQLRQEFGGAAADAANTARAAFARLENAFLDLKLEFARSGFMDAIVDAARQLTDAFKDAQFRQSVREFGQLIGSLTRFVVEHGDKLVVLGGVLLGARTGVSAGSVFGPKGAVGGAIVGGIAGGLGAASLLPDDTAGGQDEKRVMDVEAAVARLKRRIEETKQAASAGLVKPGEAVSRIREDEARIAALMAKPAASAQAAAYDTLGLKRRVVEQFVDGFRAKLDPLKAALDELKKKFLDAKLPLDSKEYREAEAIIRRSFAKKTESAPRLPRLVESFDAELAGLKAGLKTAEDMLEAAFRARLVKEEAYWRAKGEMQQRALDLETQDLQRQMADQQRLIDSLGKAAPKDANQRQEIAEKLDQAKNKLSELQIKMNEIAGRRMVVDVEVKTNLDRARQELEDLKASVRERIAEATGEMTPEMRRAAIERANREVLSKMAGDAEGEALVRRMINVEAAKAEMADLEAAWRLALETMRNAEQSANIQREQGLLTTAEAQRQIAEAHQVAARAMDDLLPKMETVARVLGPPARAQVAAFRNELAQVQMVADPLAKSLETSIKSAFEDMFSAIGSGAKTAKEAFLDFARSVIAAIQRIFAQQLAERLFGKGGFDLGSFVAKGLEFFGLKFASGGYVTGPGTSTSDSIPARLSAGEYVIRAEAVRRFGVAFMDAINGLRLPPAWNAGRLAFAAGGLVPAVAAPTPAPQQNIRIVNAVDPELARDWMESPAGERVLVNIITRNAAAIRNVLGS